MRNIITPAPYEKAYTIVLNRILARFTMFDDVFRVRRIQTDRVEDRSGPLSGIRESARLSPVLGAQLPTVQPLLGLYWPDCRTAGISAIPSSSHR